MTVHVFLQSACEPSLGTLLAPGVHVWLVESLSNRRLAEGYWDREGGGHELSTFAAMNGDGLGDVLPLLDDHYDEFSGSGELQRIVVHGSTNSDAAVDMMGEWGFRLETASGSTLAFVAQ